MKRFSFFLIIILISLGLLYQSCNPNDKSEITVKEATIPSQYSSSEISKKVKEVMSKMELVDKVGEMTQLSIDMISAGDPYNLDEPHTLDEKKLKEVLLDHRVGSILNVGGHAYTQDKWYEIMSTIQKIAMEDKPTGIPILYGIDAIHGNNYTADGTLFPQEINLAATWNPSLATQMGAISAYETKASAIPWNFSPVLDIGRNPLWSRYWETFGEDPLLATEFGEAIIKGYQGDDISHPEKVAACMKHFLGYSGPNSGKDRTQAFIPEVVLREYYLPMFQRAVDIGAATVMINSGEMNGIPVHANPKILKDLLRDELGFTGLAVTDWEDIKYLTSRHRIAKDYKEAIKIAINAGIDMSMVPMDLEFPVLLKELVEEGEVPMSRIDEAVERIITLKVQLGLFDKPFYPKEKYPKFASEEHVEASLKSAEESITLLKNEDNVLPLNSNQKVFVTGPTANSILALNGGWGRTWQGTDMKWHNSEKRTILTALEDKLGKSKVNYVEGTSYDENINISKAATAAKSSDVAIVCLGEFPYTEKPGDIDDLDLPDVQMELVKAVAKSGKPVILIFVEGRPRVFNGVEGLSSAVIQSYLPGDEGGRAIANVLLGEVNPSGKLPYTYPRYSNTLLTYDHKGTDLVKQDFSMNAFDPQYEFGHGLSYTTFEYSDLKVADKMGMDDELKISVKVTNSGDRDGKEVVQLFISDKYASITPPVKRLRGFEKVMLKKGESQEVTFTIKAKDLAFVGADNKWITEPGEFEVQIAKEKATFYLGEAK